MKENHLEYCYEYVKYFDPKFAKLIQPTDTQRIHRALCVWFAFQKSMTFYWENEEPKSNLKPFKILINRDREEIYQRINQRTGEMIKQGLIEEIEYVLKLGYKPSDYGLTSVGYTEFLDIILQKKISDNDYMKECINLATQHTRNYAKRQMTWYRKCNFDLIFKF